MAIQHLINCPEHFIESNTEQSWSQYLQNMSRLGSWAEHIIMQAVANANNLRIHITETAPNFSETTVVSSIYAQSVDNAVRDIYIGHLDELHYVSTLPIAQSASGQIRNQTVNGRLTSNPQNSQSATCLSQNSSVSMKKLQKRKEYMKE